MKVKDEDKILKQFETDYESMQGEWGQLHQDHRDDVKFTWFNDQWDTDALEDRQGPDGRGFNGLPPRPCNVFNIIKPYVIKVCNGIKKLRMGIKVAPVDSGADKDTAEVYRGLQRAIERNTGAVQSRDHAANDAVTGGYGFYAFETDYENPRSRNLELKYRTIHDATDVLWDDDDITLDGSGLKKLIYHQSMSDEEFKQKFKVDWKDMHEVGGDKMSRAWGMDDKPFISEYWYVEEIPEKLIVVKNPEGGEGIDMFLSELEEKLKKNNYEGAPEDFMEVGNDGEYIQRDSHSRKIWCCKMAGQRILSKDLWPGYWIPWFKIEGRLNVCDGEIIRSGLTRDGKASQKIYNYARNSSIERLGLSTKLSWINATDSIPSTEQAKWDTSNNRNWSNLTYNAYDEQSRPLPPPQRSQPADIDVGHVQEAQTSQNELRAEFGMYGGFMGDTQNEKSGRAILAGAQESADSVFDFADNKSATMKHEGRVRNELIPKIYDTPRQVRMVGEDDAEKVVMVNQKAKDEEGNDYYYDLKRGKYDITIEMGPSEEEKRLESREGMEIYMKALPNFAPFIADIYAKEQNWRYSDEVASRAKNWIKKTDPSIIDDKEGPPPEVQQLQQQMQQMQQMARQEIGARDEKIKELESKQAVEMAKLRETAKKNDEDNELNIYEAENKAAVDKTNAETNRMKAVADAKSKEINSSVVVPKFITDSKKDISKPERGQT